MTTAPSSIHRPTSQPQRATSKLVLSRTVGEGFSLGEQWRFDVLHLCARFVTLAVTDGSHSTSWQLEVDDTLVMNADDSVTCRRQSHSEPAPLEVRVTRVATNRVTVLIHAPRSLEITRHDSASTHHRAA